MRHKKSVIRLGRDYKHTSAVLRNMALALIKSERIMTTKMKAKALRSFIEKIITRAKVDTLHNRRIVYKDIKDLHLLTKLFEDIAKRFVSRPGGYTRIYLLGQRKGDGATSALIEFVERGAGTEDSSSDKEAKEDKKKTKKTPVKKEKTEKTVKTRKSLSSEEGV